MKPPMRNWGVAAMSAVAVVIVACGSDDGARPTTPAPGAGVDGGSSGSVDAGGADADAGVPATCVNGPAVMCTAWNKLSHCEPSTTGDHVVTETCPDGCFNGACSTTACVDECALGATAGGATCQLWDMTAKAFVPSEPTNSLHDRARDYDARLRVTNMPAGAVMNADYTDATRTIIDHYDGFHDSAIWTGSALAAQSWRLLATGSPDAAAQVAAITATLHRDYAVTGDPGYLARVVVPTTGGPVLDEQNRCTTDPEWHCGVVALGTGPLDWLGATSRDQYTGVMLGEYVAYLATKDESVKAMLRADVVAVALELIKVRKAVPASVVVDGVAINKNLDLENVILAPSEMKDGRVQINLSTSSTDDAGIKGMREFFPDYSVLVKQAVGASPAIPRPSSAIMLGAMIQIAILASDGVPSLTAQHQALLDYYVAKAPGWLDIAAGWTFSANCGSGYFANHIAFILAHAWASIDTSSAYGARIRDDVFDARLWAALKGHKNSYFAFLWGATRPTPPTAEMTTALTELAQFTPAPRVRAPRDVTASTSYLPHDTTCTAPVLCDTATLAVEVSDRVVEDFMWQRQPWQLADAGVATLVYPGVDYLAAYWAARSHGFVQDDRAGTCARFGP